MDRQERADPADMLAGVGRHWGWVLAFGIVTVLAGLFVLAWPDRTIQVIAVLFGLQLVAAGIFRFVAALATDDESGGPECCWPCWGCCRSSSGYTPCATSS